MIRPSVGRRRLSFALVFALLLTSLFLVFPFHLFYQSTSMSWTSLAHNPGDNLHSLTDFFSGSDGLRARHRFRSYEEYLQLQLNKTLNAKLREVWKTVDWRRKINVFSSIFRWHVDQGLVKPGQKVVCIGARMGQEVVAFKEVGVADVIGIDLVPAPPLVLRGDFHKHPFANSTFDFEFSNVFDHALFPKLFVSEIERTLKPAGVAVLHVALFTRPDKFSVIDLHSVDALLALFKNSDVIHIRRVDGFGLDTEVAMRKKSRNNARAASNCFITKSKADVLKLAEPLVLSEPKKPWIASKSSLRSMKYLPSLTDIRHHRRYIYVDIGSRNYGSSIGNWFQKAYPKQGHNFTIYAIEADSTFRHSYSNHPEVNFMAYAAWIRNESLGFGSDMDRNGCGHRGGMGRIQYSPRVSQKSSWLDRCDHRAEVQGLDVSEWIRSMVREEDFLVVKMDVEGAETDLVPKMVDTGAICLVDELFLECHYNRWQRSSPHRSPKYNRTYQDCVSLFRSLRRRGVLVHQWW